MSDSGNNLRHEIGHVLFIDIVGYSKLLIEGQKEQLNRLTKIVLATTQVREATDEQLVRLPAGDGMALVFRQSAEEPARCALEIAEAVRKQPELPVRMGIHSGPVSEVTDVSGRANIAGAGINVAQRVMDCGDAGHILVSKRVADDLEQYGRWRPLLHDLGTCQVKHGVTLALFNLYSEQIGNPKAPRSVQPEVKHAEKSEVVTAPAPRKSIAVLPFENLSDDKANAYFADGIQEEILMRLSRISDLKVISRTSTQRFKNTAEPMAEIAKQLGVATILEGSVRKAGDKARVHVQLIDAQNDSHLWAERYDRALTDIFAVESDIAARIAESLQARLTGAERRAISWQPTTNTEAHQLYLRGRFYWNKWVAGSMPVPAFDKSRQYYQQAIELEPNYALAYAGLADFYGFAFGFGFLPPEEKWAKAQEDNAKKALELDPTLGEAYNSLASDKLYYHRDWPGAERNFRRGLELSPNFAEMHAHYGFCLVLFGRNEEALAEMQRALDLDPLSPRFCFSSARLWFFMRQYDDALDQFRETLELDPGSAFPHEWLGYAYEKKNMAKEAIAEWSKALHLSGVDEDALVLEGTYAQSGFEAAVHALAQKQLERIKEKTACGEYIPAVEFVTAYMRLGDKEQAFAWLAKAVEERNRLAFEIKVNPIFDPLQGDSRFESLLRTVFNPR